MIIQFNFSNYKTFKERATLNMIASNYDKDTNEEDNIIRVEQRDLRVLKSAVIYGPNSGGKSKFIDAIGFFRKFIITSSKETQQGDTIPVESYRLNSMTSGKPSDFEMTFMVDRVIYRYGFEVSKSEIVAEWLYSRPEKKEIELYYRTLQKFEYDTKRLAKIGSLEREDLVRKNSLLLSVLAQFNDQTAILLLNYFRNMNAVSGLNELDYKHSSITKVKEDPGKRAQIVELLKSADLGIQDLRYEDLYESFDNEGKKMIGEYKDSFNKIDPHFFANIMTKHQVYDEHNQPDGFVEFSMSKEESEGTRKYFHFAGLVLDALEQGMILLVDELDSKLHPNLVCKIVSLFNSSITNPQNGQLIFNTHDTNLLSSGIFRRDQVWFIDKDRYGASRLYSLANFKNEVRKHEPFEDNYIRGKYGATPFLNEFETVAQEIITKNGQAE